MTKGETVYIAVVLIIRYRTLCQL